MNMNSVLSSQIESIGHDAATSTLAVKFKQGAGSIYHYSGVTYPQYTALLGAKSIGKHFGENFRNNPNHVAKRQSD